jgi:hypothetical protein
MDSFNRRAAARMCSSAFRKSRKPGSATSMKDRLSSSRKLQTRENRQQKTLGFSADRDQMKSKELLEEILDTHGGRSRWQKVETIDASLSSGGFAFTSKFQPSALHDLKVSVNPHERKVVLHGFDGGDRCGIWTPDHVQILDGSKAVISERHDPRLQFARFVKKIRHSLFRRIRAVELPVVSVHS